MSSPDQHDPGRHGPERRGPEHHGPEHHGPGGEGRGGRRGRGPQDDGTAPEWRDPEWRGPGSRGRFRHGQPSGREALTARSPLRLRAIMSAIALVGAVAAAIVFAVVADSDGAWAAAAICTFVAVVAAIDLVVIARRSRM